MAWGKYSHAGDIAWWMMKSGIKNLRKSLCSCRYIASSAKANDRDMAEASFCCTGVYYLPQGESKHCIVLFCCLGHTDKEPRNETK